MHHLIPYTASHLTSELLHEGHSCITFTVETHGGYLKGTFTELMTSETNVSGRGRIAENEQQMALMSLTCSVGT